MSRIALGATFVILVAALVAGQLPRIVEAPADESALLLRGTIERVRDGDGALVHLDSGPMEVRFYGIDAPELKAPFGREAKRALERLLGGREVELMPVSQDRYERMVAVVFAEGASVNEALLAGGYAWAYRSFLGQIPGEARYCELEAEARAARRGLWSQPPQYWLPPWVYRARDRGERGSTVASRDFSRETAADCLAAVETARERRRNGQRRPPDARPEGPPAKEPRLQQPRSRDANCTIKGNINSRGERIYHLPGSPSYDDTRIDERRGERWFCSEDEARAAGWRPAGQPR